jgi:hypothetical protein
VALGIVAIFRLHFIWLSLVGMFLLLETLEEKSLLMIVCEQLLLLCWLSRIPLPFLVATSSARLRTLQLAPSLPVASRAISAELFLVGSSDRDQKLGHILFSFSLVLHSCWFCLLFAYSLSCMLQERRKTMQELLPHLSLRLFSPCACSVVF